MDGREGDARVAYATAARLATTTATASTAMSSATFNDKAAPGEERHG